MRTPEIINNLMAATQR